MRGAVVKQFIFEAGSVRHRGWLTVFYIKYIVWYYWVWRVLPRVRWGVNSKANNMPAISVSIHSSSWKLSQEQRMGSTDLQCDYCVTRVIWQAQRLWLAGLRQLPSQPWATVSSCRRRPKQNGKVGRACALDGRSRVVLTTWLLTSITGRFIQE